MINAVYARPEEHPLKAHAALLAMSVIWGVNFAVAKVALEHLSPLAFNALRFPMASLLLFFVLRRSGAIPLPAWEEVPMVLTLGVLGNFLYQMCFIFGLHRTTAASASLLLAGTPMVTALLTAALGQERISARVWFGVVCTLAGVGLIVLADLNGEQSSGSVLGTVLMLGAILTWSFYTVGSRPLVDRHGPFAVTAWTLWIGTVGIAVVGVRDVMRLQLGEIDALTWLCIVYAGVLSIGLAYMMYYYGVSRLGNTRTGAYSNLVPVFALLSAWLWLGQPPNIFQIVGAAVIIGGVSVAQSGSLKRVANEVREGSSITNQPMP